ncbi:MAG: transporter [Acidobacteriota bacterium]
MSRIVSSSPGSSGSRSPGSVTFLLPAIVVLLMSAPALAQQEGEAEPLVTDRPDATESSETVRPGRVQLEGGYTFLDSGAVEEHSLGEVLARVGIVERLELRVGLNSFTWLQTPAGRVSGLSDTSIGLKAKVLQGRGTGLRHPTVAVLASTTLPTGADELSSDAAEPELRIAAAWELSDRVGLSSNVGWGWLNDPATDQRFHELLGSVALGYGIDDRWGAFVEYFGFYPEDEAGPDENFVDGGLTYLLTPDLQLDGRVGYRLDGAGDDFFVGFGTSVRW